MKYKHLLLGFMLFLIAGTAMSQDYSKLSKIKLKKADDYAQYDSLVLECANYIMGSSMEENMKDMNHLNALQFMMRWMQGTPDYTFMIDESTTKVMKNNDEALLILLSAFMKYTLENKEAAKDPGNMKYNAFLLFANYCENPDNKVKQTKEIKRLINAKNENTLKSYLEIKG